MPCRDSGDLLAALRGRQLAADRVQRGRAPFPTPGRFGLELHAGRQRADHQAGQKHHQEREQVLRVADGERPARRHEAEIEGGHAQNGGEDRRAAPQPKRNGHHAQQVDHHQIGRSQGAATENGAQAGAAQHHDQRPEVAEARARRQARRRGGSGRGLRIAADDVHVDVAALPRQFVHQRTAKQFLPARLLRLADDDLRDVSAAGVLDQFVGDALPAERRRLAAKLLDQPKRLRELFPVGVGEVGVAGRLDVNGDPGRFQACRHAAGGADQPAGEGAWADAHQKPFAGGPRSAHRVFVAVHVHLLADPFGRSPQGQFPQGDQVALREEVGHRPLGLAGDVDLAFPQSLQEVVGRQVHQFHFVGLLEDRIGHRLADHHAGDLRDHVVEAFEMLDVERRVNVDARLQQPHHVLPPLRVRHAGGVGVGQFVHDQQLRMQRQRRVEIELEERRPAIVDFQPGKHVQAEHQGLGFRPAMRLDVADHDVHAFLGRPCGRPPAWSRSCPRPARPRRRS